MAEREESSLIKHIPCEECGSSDGNALYTDGHTHCFVCKKTVQHGGETSEAQPKKQKAGFYVGEYQDLVARKITEDTCRKFSYAVGSQNGATVQIAPYFNEEGEIVAQKIRGANKQFHIVGSLNDAQLFGAKLWNKGKKIVVTEGEIDCLTVSQVQGNKWPVVSIPNGAAGAAKAIRRNLEYLNQFDEVIFMFDMDQAGQDAAKECAELLGVGKAKIASLPRKDPNECLKAGCPDEIISAMWNAKTYRPDGLVGVSDVLAEIDMEVVLGLPWFLEDLTKLTYGRRLGEVYGFGAATGGGKTDLFTQQIAYDIKVLKQKVGLIFLEQKPKETILRVAGKCAGKRFHVPNDGWTKDERTKAVTDLDGSVTLYDSFGQTEWEVVANKIRFMAVSEEIKLFYLDHLTAMADTADERGSLEQIMKEMAGLAQELQIIIHFISHLTTPEGKPHEEGGHVSIRHFKGSRAIGFWSYFMFGLERNQQAEDPEQRSTTTFRCLKDRYTGQATGCLLYLGYDPVTGLLFQKDTPEAAPFTDQTNKDY